MAIECLTQARIFHGGLDFSPLANSVMLKASVDVHDTTTFVNAGWRAKQACLADASMEVSGFWEAATVDASLFAGIGQEAALSVAAGTDEGDVTFVGSGVPVSYEWGSQVGALKPFSAALSSDGALVRGQLLAAEAITGAGNSTGLLIGALSASQVLVVNLHVLSVASGSVTVEIESDSSAGFGSPTTRGTFTASAASGAEAIEVSGAVADTFWRASWTFSGSAAEIAVAAGIR